MTQTPIRPNNDPNKNSGLENPSLSAQERRIEETLTLVPVQSLSSDAKHSALSSKAGALVGELSSLRSNIDMMTDELQSLLATERAAVERAELLNAMTSHIRESLNFEYILNATVTDARNALDVDRVVVYIFDENWLAKGSYESVERLWPSALGSYYMGNSMSDQAIKLYQQGRVEAVDDVSNSVQLDSSLLEQLQRLDTQASLTTPLLLEGDLYGLLVAHHCSNAREWSESEIDFFRQLAVQVGYALDQAQLLGQQREAAEQAQWLNQIGLRIRESLTADDIFAAAVQEVHNALKGDRVVVCRLNAEGQNQVVAESVERQFPTTMGMALPSPWLALSYLEAYQRGQLNRVNDVYELEIDDATLDQLKARAIRASLVAPIMAKQKLMGFLVVHQCTSARRWTGNETEILKKAAVQIGTALDQAFALQQQEDAALQAQILNDISARLGGYSDIEEILDSVVDDAREALKVDRVVIFKVDAQLKGTAIAESSEPRWKSLLDKSLHDCGLDERYVKQAQRGKITVLSRMTGAGLSEFQREHLELSQVRSLMIAPVTIEKKLFGLMVVHSCQSVRQWQESENSLLRQISNQVSFALERINLIEQRQMTAERAQRLSDVSARLQESFEVSEILNAAVDEARDILDADRVFVHKFDGEWRGIVNAESVATGVDSVLGFKTNEQLVGDKLAKSYIRGKVLAYENVYEAGFIECQLKEVEAHGVKAYMAVGLVANQKLYGMFMVQQCSDFRQWTDTEINTLKQIAQQTGYVLEQAFLREEQERAKRLNETRLRLQESSEVEAILNVAVEETREILGSDRAIIYEFDSSWKGIITSESVNTGYPATLGVRTNEPHVTEKFSKYYLKGNIKTVTDIFNSDFVDCHVNEFSPYGVKGYMAAGIVANQRLYGLLVVHQCSNTRSWTELETDTIRQLSEQIGYALDQALLRRAQEEAVARTKQVNLISFRVRESLDVERIFRTGTEEALKLMKCDRVVVYRFDENWGGNIPYEAVASGWRKLSQDMMADGEVPCFPEDYVEPYRQGRVQVTPDVNQAGLTACHEEQLGKWQVKANVVVPILVNQKLYGLLGAHQCSSTREWEAPLVESFRQVAIQLGYALDQALLLNEIEESRQQAEETSQEQRQQKEQLQGQIENFLEEIENSFEGDLTVRAGVTEGEMGTVADFFNATIENLQQLVQQVQDSTSIVSETAQDSESQIKNLSTEALRQAESVGEALQKITDMTTSIREVATNAQDAQQKVQLANKTLKAGDVAMNRTVQGILAIQQTVEATARKVKNLADASQKISRVLNLIRELANQTNLLALNASVEATRAGEEEQGFAVANEVRTLAEQSANATKEIEEIIEEIQSETNEVIKAMDIGRKRVLIGTKLVKGTRQTLTDLAKVSTSINRVVEEIAKSASTQVNISNELNQTMQDVAEISSQTSEQSVKVAESFTKLLGVAGELQQSVSEFKVQ
ncbi:methyl-accepting chemotaxis sensory transducer with GAF sensor [[Leptolyngbya] sp. PCC 7376]|uniref:GAF domain-containing protein n=1 Tax=[Leptolyngbya] sp. PCC 7376 TaxID=111781 RepID=UPI00029F14CA|nr:GAF domain-containing protein [[Leptolyngbya] sp. PCC 7376]AFY38018.1 methyl-accepting chemotaxis sensory transducer with GAF sensor [[Leptolyngbya] sp. PCC 7376]